MANFASLVLTLLAAALVIPSAVFCVEIIAAIFLTTRGQFRCTIERRGRIVALVPAHNESAGLLPTLSDLKGQLRPSDRLVVVADNCTDDTAAVAKAAGAEVTIRTDKTKIGKGYALDWGLRLIETDPPDIVVMVDADCRVAPSSIDHLAALSQQSDRPVQALNLMSSPPAAAINQQVATFAWRVKNWVRPSGLQALGLPCQLTGTGMAFPWKLIHSAELSTGLIVEDLKLGLDLALIGHAPLFCPSAMVSSTFPITSAGADAQRQRWEHGHIGLIASHAIPLAWQSLRRGNVSALALALDLLVPPLSLLIITLTVITAAASLLLLCGGSTIPFKISLSCLAGVTVATMMAWSKFAREILPPRAFGLISVYLLRKLRLHIPTLAGRRVSRWERAERDSTNASDSK
jgi:cellulose synthase/poly-beta-1,6-N-acetylglucosamine synthase-like glycosyltransferase